MSNDPVAVEPVNISVKEAARIIGISAWSVYQLCDANMLVSGYHGKRRLVDLESARDYARSLPRERPEASA